MAKYRHQCIQRHKHRQHIQLMKIRFSKIVKAVKNGFKISFLDTKPTYFKKKKSKLFLQVHISRRRGEGRCQYGKSLEFDLFFVESSQHDLRMQLKPSKPLTCFQREETAICRNLFVAIYLLSWGHMFHAVINQDFLKK